MPAALVPPPVTLAKATVEVRLRADGEMEGFSWLSHPGCSMLLNIFLHDWASFGVNVGKYSSSMEHLGIDLYRFISLA